MSESTANLVDVTTDQAAWPDLQRVLHALELASLIVEQEAAEQLRTIHERLRSGSLTLTEPGVE